ncbi:Putative Cell wall mannoprotein [Septoria linicola]|uniref:Cell wall mannoprotein n=1 Tax=Septoria linicola TaxID=215465 RepID=A0A9Q9EQT2_9PEZI|nr:Putative Cell wall mannoprotein [Septoria linicola]
MRLTSLIISGLLTVASAHPLYSVVKRDAASIVAALKTVQTNVQTLNTTVTSFNKGDIDGLFKVLKIQKQTSAVGKSVEAATQTAQASEVLNEDDTFKVAEGVLALKADLDTFLPNLSSKKPAFDSVGVLFSVSKTVLKSLQDQKAQSGALGGAITPKLTGPLAGFAPLINAQIAEQFDKAIAVFQQPGGVIPLPAIPSFP